MHEAAALITFLTPGLRLVRDGQWQLLGCRPPGGQRHPGRLPGLRRELQTRGLYLDEAPGKACAFALKKLQ